MAEAKKAAPVKVAPDGVGQSDVPRPPSRRASVPDSASGLYVVVHQLVGTNKGTAEKPDVEYWEQGTEHEIDASSEEGKRLLAAGGLRPVKREAEKADDGSDGDKGDGSSE